ncbi:MAG: aspartate kinase [Gammaproteobacteria bacterium]|nr:MAG: aspartate kinase [Gammaproteobacteria bacterium]
MALIVQKFGGTSVGSLERIENAARRVAQAKKQGHDVVVVSSAMAGTTDRLINLAKEVQPIPNPRELDMLLATGEQQAIALFAMTLQKMGFKAVSLCGWQVPVITDDVHTKARIKEIHTKKLKELLSKGYIPIVAGFQGVTKDGEITTLGRGGSDTSAVALAAALKADFCEIYTDVDGIYTADPRIVPNARKIEKIAYEEMLELASLGAKVMQIRSVEFGSKYGVRIHVRSSFSEEEGSWIVPEEEIMEKVAVRGITSTDKEVQFTVVKVPDKPGIAAKIFKALGDAHIAVDMIVQTVSVNGYTDMSFTVSENDAPLAKEIIEKVAKEIGAERVLMDTDVSKVSVVGLGMRSAYGVAGKMFDVLAKHNINIKAISTSEIRISCLIDRKYTELAVRALHEAFIENDTVNFVGEK